MMKIQYEAPTLQIVDVQSLCSLLAGSPESHDEVSDKPSYAKETSWSDDFWNADEETEDY
jgi:hypothetical protein